MEINLRSKFKKIGKSFTNSENAFTIKFALFHLKKPGIYNRCLHRLDGLATSQKPSKIWCGQTYIRISIWQILRHTPLRILVTNWKFISKNTGIFIFLAHFAPKRHNRFPWNFNIWRNITNTMPKKSACWISFEEHCFLRPDLTKSAKNVQILRFFHDSSAEVKDFGEKIKYVISTTPPNILVKFKEFLLSQFRGKQNVSQTPYFKCHFSVTKHTSKLRTDKLLKVTHLLAVKI